MCGAIVPVFSFWRKKYIELGFLCEDWGEICTTDLTGAAVRLVQEH